MTSLHHAALGLQMFLRCGRVDVGRLARLWSCKRRAMVFKPGKRRETGALFGRPRRRSGQNLADRVAGVSLHGRHVLARRFSRAGGQFEFSVVLLHLRNACPSLILKNGSGRLRHPLAPPVAAPRTAARRLLAPRASRMARARAPAAPVGRSWLFQYFSLRRLLPGAPRSDEGTFVIFSRRLPHTLLLRPGYDLRVHESK